MSLIRSYYDNIHPSDSFLESEKYIKGEWLVTNGLGGYSSGTVIGMMTRKYHALLVSSLPPPSGRTIMLNHLMEEVIFKEGRSAFLNCEETQEGNLDLRALTYLKSFYLENGLPVWKYDIEGIEIEKRVFMPHRQNSVYVCYKLLSGAEQLTLQLRPLLHFRSYETPVNIPLDEIYMISIFGENYELSKKDFFPLRLCLFGSSWSFTIDSKIDDNVFLRIESARGYESRGQLWTPGKYQILLKKNVEVAFVASTEKWKKIKALDLPQAKKAEGERRKHLNNLLPDHVKGNFVTELTFAADQFIIIPENRIEDGVRANASGDEIRTIIAGYHWFNDWGRDTMISLEGLTLCTGRAHEARWILKTFAHYVRDGLIPNMFPESKNEGLYHTADATLWFFHAVERYVSVTGDDTIIEELLPILCTIIEHHVKGTRFGIVADGQDGLLKQGAEGYQLTWMDAKVGDWVVTPRRGKAVEINALWYNALKLMEKWMRFQNNQESIVYYQNMAEKVRTSFNTLFWIEEKGYLFDVIGGEKGENDDSFRPNQLFAISLDYPVLDPRHWKSVVDLCKEKLLTPFGLRTLSPEHRDFKQQYKGDLRSRDAAYHQGTVWPWLIGPFIDAWLKVYEDKKQGRQFLRSFESHLADAGVGTISEIFDASEPYISRGCIAQAWSVAEVLRTWLKTV